METPKPTNLKDAVLAKIQSHDISMRPRIFYTLRLVGLFILSVAVLLLSILIANYVSFSIRINGHDALLSYGPQGFLAFLHFFPWPILVLDVFFIAVLQHMVRKFSFGYRKPVLYLFGILFLVIIAAGLVLDRETRVNDSFYEGAGRAHPSFVGMFYRRFHAPHRPGSGVCANCTIITIKGNVLTAEDRAFGTSTSRTIVVPENDPLLPSLKIGDIIFVLGREASGTLYAFGLRQGPPGPRPK
ncbi:MAG: hypothetical protein JWL75_278 [Parcubacteria group bacterium]|nr:hypothetical protein [Parcubacteria group bacterium]